MQEAAGKKKALNDPAHITTVFKENPLQNSPAFLEEISKETNPVVQSSIGMQILLEIRRTNRILRELRNAYLGVSMTFAELDNEVELNGK